MRLCLVLLLVTATIVKGQTGEKHVPVPNYPTSSSSEVPPTSPPTKPTTSPNPPTPTTKPVTPPTPTTSPKPPTLPPNITTPVPPTPKPPTPPPNTTTPLPTTPPTTPTPSPASTTAIPIPPKPEDQPGTWVANYTDTNRTCIVANFAAQIEIPYSINNASNSSYVGYLSVPPNANVTGNCSNSSQSIILSWSLVVNSSNTLELIFKKPSANATKYDLDQLKVSAFMDNGTFPGIGNGTRIVLQHNNVEFNTTLDRSYKCFKTQRFNLTTPSDLKTTVAFLNIRHVQLQAFRNATGTVFAEAEDCAPYETPDVVPIAVGCALIALILIVLVAYLIGRRRNQARGYLSMFMEKKKESEYIPMKTINCFN